ncbi:hypothetical protein [Spongiimicrobium salis]|uniref:hypothetical protein n=1 Tax=Spongiimicrobium salis TaxID=1667022 RepID=UPI00374DE923
MIVQKMHRTTGFRTSVIVLETRRYQQAWIVPNGNIFMLIAFRIDFLLTSVWRGGLFLFEKLLGERIILLALDATSLERASKKIAPNR